LIGIRMTATRFVLFALLAVPAAADTGSVTLVYERGADALACPDVEVFKRAVDERLGRPVWGARSRRGVFVHLGAPRYGYAARVELWQDGARRGERELSSTGSDCAPLADAVALATSVAIDPLHALVPAPRRAVDEPVVDHAERAERAHRQRPRPLNTGGRSTAALPRPLPSPLRDDRTGLSFELGGGGFAGLGAGPGALGGLTLQAAARSGPVSFHLELRGEVPGRLPLAGQATLGGSLLAGSVAPCVRFVGGPFLPNERVAWASLCALGTLGAVLVGADGISRARGAASPWAGVGGRLHLDVLLLSHLIGRGYFEVVAPVLSARLIDEVTGATLWEPPVLAVSIGIQGLALLP
jgi:hypothetical protein